LSDSAPSVAEYVQIEREAEQRLDLCLAIIALDLRWYWQWGDGAGGFFLQKLRAIVVAEGYLWPFDPGPESTHKRKASISNTLRTKVYERDLYRCVDCGTHLNLTCDHVIAESPGGETTLENLATRCKSCNSKKGTRA
jgi:DNA-directed RNA polymerase subunit RPC12/RpoP